MYTVKTQKQCSTLHVIIGFQKDTFKTMMLEVEECRPILIDLLVFRDRHLLSIISLNVSISQESLDVNKRKKVKE